LNAPVRALAVLSHWGQAMRRGYTMSGLDRSRPAVFVFEGVMDDLARISDFIVHKQAPCAQKHWGFHGSSTTCADDYAKMSGGIPAEVVRFG